MIVVATLEKRTALTPVEFKHPHFAAHTLAPLQILYKEIKVSNTRYFKFPEPRNN
jgi:hypothetical protein